MSASFACIWRCTSSSTVVHNLGLLCDVLHWVFRGYFVLMFFAKRIPRVAVVALLGLTCLFYGCFWWGHFVNPYHELYPRNPEHYEESLLRNLILLISAQITLLIEEDFLPILFFPGLPLVALLLRHAVSLLSIAFLARVALVDRAP